MKILHVEASPRGAGSVSRTLAAAFIEAIAQRRPVDLERLDVWSEPLPAFDGAALAAKYARLQKADLRPAQAAAWRPIEALVARLADCDALVVSTPMWNFGIPYRLKHWIDLVTQPGLSFAFEPGHGYRPLLTDRPVAVVLASAGDYAEGPSWGRPDLASGYLRAALGFLGLVSVEVIQAGPTVGEALARERGLEAARAALQRLADTWGDAR